MLQQSMCSGDRGLTLCCLSSCDMYKLILWKCKRQVFKLLIKKSSKSHTLKMGGEASLIQHKICSCYILADLYGSSECTTVNVFRCTKTLHTVARMNFTPTGNTFYLHCLTSMDMDAGYHRKTSVIITVKVWVHITLRIWDTTASHDKSIWGRTWTL